METGKPSDAELVARTLAGDREAFGSLYDRYARLVRATVFGVAGEYAAVQDLTQECFLRAFRNLRRLRRPDRFGAWLVGIARWVARERRRSLRRDRHRFVDRDALSLACPGDGIERMDAGEELGRVMMQVAALPERERLAIHVFFLQGCDVRQAGELLNLSRSGVYALLDRALGRLAGLVRGRKTQQKVE
jgi:RNA polymerase sigma-70 factor (ECF subfamily)